MFILLLFSSFTAKRSCWQAEVRRAGPAGRNGGPCKLCQAFLLLRQEVRRKSLILNPQQLGSVGGPTFKVNSPCFWPLHTRKPVSPGDLSEGSSGPVKQSHQLSGAVGNGAPAQGAINRSRVSQAWHWWWNTEDQRNKPDVRVSAGRTL